MGNNANFIAMIFSFIAALIFVFRGEQIASMIMLQRYIIALINYNHNKQDE